MAEGYKTQTRADWELWESEAERQGGEGWLEMNSCKNAKQREAVRGRGGGRECVRGREVEKAHGER